MNSMFPYEDVIVKSFFQLFLLFMLAICVIYMILTSEPDISSGEHSEVVFECYDSCENKAHQRLDLNFEEVR